MTGIANTPLFTSYRKDARTPLSEALEKLALDEGGIQQAFHNITTVEQLDDFNRRLPSAIARIRPTPPKLGGAGVRSTSGGAFKPVAGDSSLQQQSTRYRLAVQIEGDVHLLTFWPDAVDDVPEPAADDMWTLGHETELSGGTPTTVLYSHIDLTPTEEEAATAGEIDVQKIFDDRIGHIEKIVNKIAEQTDAYFDQGLPARLADKLSQKRVVLQRRETIVNSLVFNRSWRINPPALEPLAESGDVGSKAVPRASSTSVHGVPFRDRLAPAAFEDVVRVIRVWANAVERTPKAFAGLKEDDLSSLLAATLNATLPGAAREVFTRTGKSDILITADKLDEGRKPAKVFICEAKFADTDRTVTNALQPQLFSYLNTYDTAAVLLLFFRQKHFRSARTSRLSALEKIDCYTGRLDEISEWPVLEYQVEDRSVRICVASVHVAPYLNSDSEQG